MTTDERLAFLIARQKGIGSSDAPNLCGVGFQDAASVYRSKTKPITLADAMGKGILKRGNKMEPLVAEEYTEEMGIELVRAPMATHPKNDWQLASPDYLHADDPGRMVELKTVGGFGFDWGQTGTDDFPEGYRVQCQHQMGVRGVRMMDLAALDVVSWELRVYRLNFDPSFFEWLTDLEFQAWTLIKARLPIGAEWEQRWKADAKAMIDNGSRFQLPDDTLPILERREVFREIQAEAKAQFDDLTKELYVRMGDFYKAECGGWKVSQWMVKGSESYVVREPHRRIKATPPKGRPAPRIATAAALNSFDDEHYEKCYQSSISPESETEE